MKYIGPAWEVEATENPFGIGWLELGAGAAILGAGGFALWRITQRNRLAEMLGDSALVAEARGLGLVTWTPEEKAADVIGWFSLRSAQQGYLVVLDEVRKLLPPEAAVSASSMLTDLTNAGFDLYSKLPDVPGVDTTGLFNWAMGKWSS